LNNHQRIIVPGPFATEAAYGVGLLLFWAVAFQVLRSEPATLGFQVGLFMVRPSGCPFVLSCDGISGTKCHSGSDAHFPKDLAPVSDNFWPKPFIF
jgi:hypothetical protein